MDYYSSNVLADLELFLFNSNGTPVESSVASNSNVEIITYEVTNSGYYKIMVQPVSNYSNTHEVRYAYWIH